MSAPARSARQPSPRPACSSSIPLVAAASLDIVRRHQIEPRAQYLHLSPCTVPPTVSIFAPTIQWQSLSPAPGIQRVCSTATHPSPLLALVRWNARLGIRYDLPCDGNAAFLSLQADALQQNCESRIRPQGVKRRLDLKQGENKVVIFVSLV